jgi:hypothetical protein
MSPLSCIKEEAFTPSSLSHQQVFWRRCRGGKKTSTRGVSHAHPLLCFKFCFTLFLLASFYQKPKKLVSFIVYFTCLLLILLEWILLRTPSCAILLALIIVILSAHLLRHLLLLQIFMRLVKCPCVATDLKFIFTFNTCNLSTHIMLLYYHPLSRTTYGIYVLFIRMIF